MTSAAISSMVINYCLKNTYMQVRLKLHHKREKKNPVDPLRLSEKDMQECNNTCDFCFLKKKKEKH